MSEKYDRLVRLATNIPDAYLRAENHHQRSDLILENKEDVVSIKADYLLKQPKVTGNLL
jgi:hypothetical protein